MKLASFIAVGFCTFSLCSSFCPMNAGVLTMNDDMNMHMAHEQMDHNTDEVACAHCIQNTQEDLAIVNTVPETESPVTMPSIALFQNRYAPQHTAEERQMHLAAAGPPIGTPIVRSIVMRT